MTEVPSSNPHKEEDEGYLAAEAGQSLSDNPYPCGTIRHEHWRRGWNIKNDEARHAARRSSGDGQADEGYRAAEAGQGLGENPYPSGTIRHDDWRCGWHIKSGETQRMIRLNRQKPR